MLLKYTITIPQILLVMFLTTNLVLAPNTESSSSSLPPSSSKKNIITTDLIELSEWEYNCNQEILSVFKYEEDDEDKAYDVTTASSYYDLAFKKFTKSIIESFKKKHVKSYYNFIGNHISQGRVESPKEYFDSDTSDKEDEIRELEKIYGKTAEEVVKNAFFNVVLTKNRDDVHYDVKRGYHNHILMRYSVTGDKLKPIEHCQKVYSESKLLQIFG